MMTKTMRIAATISACLLLGCSQDSRPQQAPDGPAEPSPPVTEVEEQEREVKYARLGKRFGEVVLAGDLDVSYGMTSSHFQARYTKEQYRELWGKAWTEYGEFGPPKCVEGDVNMVDPAMIREEDVIPEGVPPDIVEASAFAVFVVEGECDNADRCWEAWLLFVREGGVDRVADIDFMWCD